MSKIFSGMLVATFLAGLAAFTLPARAEIQYPWCIQYAGGQHGIGAVSCGFVSREQCMATARGLGSMCMENPAYPTILKRPIKVRRHSQ
jgi:hypothetical protein